MCMEDMIVKFAVYHLASMHTHNFSDVDNMVYVHYW